ncbi:MAG: calcium-binding protein [Nannocystaceae bacterium]
MTRTLSLALLLPTLSLVAAGCDKDDAEPVASAGDSASAGDEGEEGEETEGFPAESDTDTDGGETDGGETDGGETDGEPEPEPEPEPQPKPDAVEPCADDYSAECTTEGGVAGESYCIVVDGEETWTECLAEVECMPGDSYDFGCMGDICYWDGEGFKRHSWSEPDCNTPLVVNFEREPLRFEAGAAAAFDINGVGECLSTDWPTLPWLALDRDGNGVIDSGRELFGSGTRLASGDRADHGFTALRELDADGDGKITAADPAFAELVLWSDLDGDRRGELRELIPVAEVNLVAIDLAYDRLVECDDRGNCGAERSAFEFRDASGLVRSGEIVDVYLPCQ